MWVGKGGGPEGWGPEGWGPEGWGPEGWGPEGWGPRRVGPRRVGPPKGGAPKGGAPKCAQMCTFGVLGLSCASPGGPGLVGPPGFHTTDSQREPKRAHLSARSSKTPPKFNEKTSQRGKKRTNFAAGHGKKRAKFWAVQGEGGPGGGRAVQGRAVP